VRRTSPAIDAQNRTLRVEVEVQNKDGALRPGAFARGAILVHTDPDALCVPQSAVITFAGLQKVLVVRDGKAVEQRVRTGRRLDDQVEILQGLNEGDPVIVEPADLTGGHPVTVAS
jgi:RND family efflux transporter MFP subunit